MPVGLDFSELLEYTDWQRSKWQDWFLQQGGAVLQHSAGPHGDGRFQTVGDIIRHIFSAEKRYVDRLSNQPLSDTASIPNDNVEALFQFGAQTRSALRKFINTFPEKEWDVLQEFNFMNNLLRATPRKLIAHVLLHEIRHWAQIGTLYRLDGLKVEMQDFLFSPVLGGELRKAAN